MGGNAVWLMEDETFQGSLQVSMIVMNMDKVSNHPPFKKSKNIDDRVHVGRKWVYEFNRTVINTF